MKKNYFSLPARTVPRCEDGRRPVASASSMPRLFNFHLLCSGMVLLLLKFKTTLLWRKGRYFATFRCALEIYKCILKVFFFLSRIHWITWNCGIGRRHSDKLLCILCCFMFIELFKIMSFVQQSSSYCIVLWVLLNVEGKWKYNEKSYKRSRPPCLINFSYTLDNKSFGVHF